MKCRIWSNQELMKFAPQYTGRVVNVSGWKDDDKQGRKYRDYFTKATEYKLTNFPGERGWQEGDIVLDLESQYLSDELIGRFDVVFNHTTIEHIFTFKVAFDNLCKITTDRVIIVVPKAQKWHGTQDYGDYWRFTEQALEKMFKGNFMEIEYMSESDTEDGIYLFCIASKSKYETQHRLSQ